MRAIPGRRGYNLRLSGASSQTDGSAAGGREFSSPLLFAERRDPMDPYMTKAEALLHEAKARLDRLSATMSAAAPEFSALARRRKLMNYQARYSEVSRRFELLRTAGTDGIADLKVGLEKAWEA